MAKGAKLSVKALKVIVGKAPQFNARARAILGSRANTVISRALGKKTIASLRASTLRSKHLPTFKVGGYPRKPKK